MTPRRGYIPRPALDRHHAKAMRCAEQGRRFSMESGAAASLLAEVLELRDSIANYESAAKFQREALEAASESVNALQRQVVAGERIVDAALDWENDIGLCHFCGYNVQVDEDDERYQPEHNTGELECPLGRYKRDAEAGS